MPRPVFIDLYFTLIEPDPAADWIADASLLLGVDADALRAASMVSFNDRMVGAVATAEEVIDSTLAALGRRVEPHVHARLVEHRWSYFHGLRLYPDTLPTLRALRERGHKLALITNCSTETAAPLERLGLAEFFDAMALSCDLRAAKPDPAIYQYALDKLGLDPRTVVYVGDGDTQEHAGAARFGMTTVLLKRPDGPRRDVTADYTIGSLLELLELPALADAAQPAPGAVAP